MSTRKQDKAVHNLQQIWQISKTNPKQQMQWLLRGLLVIGRQQHLSEAGFILPTVAMVSLVVVLLTTAMMIRAFDQSKYASNVRVNQAVLNAATPALDRARTKLDALLADPTLPRATPSDIALYNALTSTKYNLGDETSLKLVKNIGNGSGGSPNTAIESLSAGTATKLENDETLTTAWKFPVDTDNNGKFDSYTLYSINFRSPSRGTDGNFNRARNPLEARTPPMSGGITSGQCANATGTSASLVGDSSWYKSGSKLTKSFFVYTATVPITETPASPTVGAADDYETYKGNKGFSALEYQQDRSRVPINNNAVLFQDDLEISPGPAFRLNGRVFTNANLLIGSDSTMQLYQVSSKYSCFYNEENSKITVGGNVSFGGFGNASPDDAVDIDLFKGFGIDPGSAVINVDNKSASNSGGDIAYNDAAYNRRISLMKATALSYIDTTPTIAEVLAVTKYPQDVKDRFQKRMEAPGGSSLTIQDVLGEEIEIYLKDRTRRVPFAEVANPAGTGAIGTYDTDNDGIDIAVFPSTLIEPPASWREPTDTNTGLTLTNLAQTQPEKQKKDAIEELVGDRVNVGNNLPGYWKKDGKYVTGQNEPQLLGSTIFWNNPSDKLRYRTTQVIPLPDLGVTERNGLWEDSAAQPASNESPNIGGLRVITGAGIYRTPSSSYAALTTASLMTPPTALDTGAAFPNAPLLAGEGTATQYTPVWYDTTPMKGGIDPITGIEVTAPPDLRMRATAVYHYKGGSAGTNQLPIACVSSYYDSTNSVLAQNGKYGTADGFSWGTGGTNLPTNPNAEITGAAGSGRSNNGVVYPGLAAADRTNTTYITELKAQAKLMFPNRRIVNEPLQKALQKLSSSGGLIDSTKPLSLADNSAIDSAVCAIKILTNATTPSSTPVIPHGAIKEAAFLNAREVKAIEGTDSNPINYDLALEQRQPSEIRVTEIDLRQLAITTIGTTPKQEYLLPNSGIIYASRDDALLDQSDTSSSEVQKKLLSPTDFRLDPTRRPTGIRLINGSNLSRVATYREEEKGLILASNLPVYVKADANNGFNLHQKPGGTTAVEEFLTFLTGNWSNFYDRDDLDNNFACRSGQTGCATGANAGDKWRPATIIADTMTLLSNSFRDGFRNEGDFDLNNNAGITATAARKKNGFWNNNFVTSAFWWLNTNTDNAYPYEKTTNSYVGSYFINGVTPIQRRVDFPEYLMEYCPKVPVSLCTPSDWVINTLNVKATGAINAPFASATHQAGTTATAPSSTIERYARRLAFKRKSNNTLELTTHGNGEATPIPLGIDSSGAIKEFPYPYGAGATATLPRLNNDVNNALWYQTSSNRDGKPNLNTTFETDQPLSYTGKTKLISPPTPEISGVRSLNLPAGNPASGYTICTKTKGSTTNASISVTTPLEKPNCDSGSNPLAAIENTLTDLLALNPDASSSDEVARPIQVGTFAAGTPTVLTQTNRTNVINVGDLPTNNVAYTTIKLVGNENSIFVLRKTSSNLEFGGGSGHYGVKVELDGVDPNNVFWAVDGNMKWNAVNSSTPHRMSGTFINKGTGSPKWENLILEGGRILGVNGVPSPSSFTADTRIEAIASNGQPEVVPVLQVHTPQGTPTATTTNLPFSGKIELQWLQNVTAVTTKINATFVAGNSPSRPTEGADDFENFVRFLEKWSEGTANTDTKRELNIRGSFIQLKRSTYATGPKNAGLTNVTSLFPGFAAALYPEASAATNKTPYAEAPNRQWGFDVAILSQSPDLFAQRFTTPPKAPPDEFFREVGRDDEWVQNLLCAAEASDRVGGSGATYTTSAAIGSRPSSCLTSLPYPANP